MNENFVVLGSKRRMFFVQNLLFEGFLGGKCVDSRNLVPAEWINLNVLQFVLIVIDERNGGRNYCELLIIFSTTLWIWEKETNLHGRWMRKYFGCVVNCWRCFLLSFYKRVSFSCKSVRCVFTRRRKKLVSSEAIKKMFLVRYFLVCGSLSFLWVTGECLVCTDNQLYISMSTQILDIDPFSDCNSMRCWSPFLENSLCWS